mgnify:CR=1 FL=1|jgi:hypothetical protein
MKQKKAPTTLIAAVVVMLLLGGLVNATGFLQDPMRFFRSQEQPKEAAPTELTEAQKKQNKEMLRGVARTKKEGPEGPGGPQEELVNGVPKEPTILIPEIAVVKPQINDSNVSAQWYREESRQKKLSEEKAKELAGSGQ